MARKPTHTDATRVIEAGRDHARAQGVVNSPVYHVSTVLFATVAELEYAAAHPDDVFYYGRRGSPTTFAFAEAIAELEGGAGTVVTGCGLSAVTTSLLSFLNSGDHLLMTDSVYGPTRNFCNRILKRLGIETSYYDPCIGGGITTLFQDNTKVVFVESPGSLTFEVQDIPAIAAAAHARGALVIMDNTWATPLYFKPFEKGVDISVQAATKFIVGHSDAMLGTATATAEHWPQLRRMSQILGQCAAPDDVYLAQRGLRTLAVRLQRHYANAVALANWCAARPEVARVIYPALPSDPGHALWKRDFLGASGLFGIELATGSKPAIAAMLDGLELFGMGFSWGGYESLILPADPNQLRTATHWQGQGQMLRIHAGLEDAGDLIADLECGFDRLNAAMRS